MRNKYKIENNEVIIFFNKNKGNITHTKVSISKLPKLKNFDVTWFPAWRNNSNAYYVVCCEYLGMIKGKPKYKTHYLHRFINDVIGYKKQVDHKDGNKMNNLNDNLLISNHANNGKNREKINKNNKSGYRNVFWDKSINKWVVRLQINGNNKCLGKFDDVNKANNFAKKMREKYYKEHKGIDK
jgi:hypothetical protein